MKKYRKGVVIGKFYIYHLGHHKLIQYAMDQCYEVHVLVEENSKYTISAEIRASWIQEDFQTAIVHIVNGEPETEIPEQWGWRTRFVLREDKRGNDPYEGPDVVFSSEDYGEPYAKSMGAEHVMVDRERIAIPCSGHELRADIMGNFQYLSRPAKAYFAKRFIIVGAESSGKTTLAKALAEKFNTVWSPEYGRLYWEGKVSKVDNSSNKKWYTSEFMHIATMQAQMSYELAKDANRVIIEDTDEFATELWHERYVGYTEPRIRFTGLNRRNPYIYVLADIDIPFVQDGYRDGEGIRTRMHKEFLLQLIQRDLPYIVVSGSLEERIKKASNIIEVMLANPVDLNIK